MPALPEPPPGDDTTPPGQGLAVAAESLYLINLLLLPGLGFLLLLGLYFRYRNSASPLARVHLRQTVSASLWAGALLILANLAIVVLGGYQAGTWIIVILYFTTVHATLVLLGILGLARALAGQPCRYPLIGTLLS